MTRLPHIELEQADAVTKAVYETAPARFPTVLEHLLAHALTRRLEVSGQKDHTVGVKRWVASGGRRRYMGARCGGLR